MAPNPKLVEALADLYARFLGWDTVNEREREFAAHVIETLRLVQLPEEPSGWVPVTEEGAPIWGGARKHEQDAKGYGLPVHLVYTVPPLEAPDDP